MPKLINTVGEMIEFQTNEWYKVGQRVILADNCYLNDPKIFVDSVTWEQLIGMENVRTGIIINRRDSPVSSRWSWTLDIMLLDQTEERDNGNQ